MSDSTPHCEQPPVAELKLNNFYSPPPPQRFDSFICLLRCWCSSMCDISLLVQWHTEGQSVASSVLTWMLFTTNYLRLIVMSVRTLSTDGCHRLMSTNETQMRWWDWDWISHFWTYFCPYLLSDPTRLSLLTCSTLNTLNYAVKYPSNKDLLETCELKWNSHCTWTVNTSIKLPHLELRRNVPKIIDQHFLHLSEQTKINSTLTYHCHCQTTPPPV